jgi:hypothetical protein
VSRRKSKSSPPALEDDAIERPGPRPPRRPLTVAQFARLLPVEGGPIACGLRLLGYGFRLFPLTPEGKPAFADFPNRATTCPRQFAGWMTQDCPAGIIQSEMAYGVALGGPLPDGGYALAADLDVKNGKEGPKSWIGLGQDYPYADTLAVRTASGGTHFYYSAPGVFSQKIGLRDGIDIKGFHTYTVGPGSIIKGRCYTIVHDVPPRPLPPELAPS